MTTPRSFARAGLSRAKVDFLRSLAEHVLSGELELERLGELADERGHRGADAVKGHRRVERADVPDVPPRAPRRAAVGDLGIRRAIERAYGLEALPGPARDGGDRRAVAPAPHARVQVPVALAQNEPAQP